MNVDPYRIEEIYRYPVKSMLGERLERCVVEAGGLAGDRAYALLDTADGNVVSAKNPRKWGQLLQFSAEFISEPVAGEPAPPIRITFPDDMIRRSDDPDIDAELSAAIGRDVRLVSCAPEGKFFEEVWPDIEGLAPETFINQTSVGHEPGGESRSQLPLGLMAPPDSFFDLAVLHLITTATLDALSAQAPAADFDVRRYRPNLVLTVPGERFAEHDWLTAELSIGEQLAVRITMPTMRCVMTTLAQRGLDEDRETLRTIAKHNRLDIPDLGTWACAGVYADVRQAGVVRVGDPVIVGGV